MYVFSWLGKEQTTMIIVSQRGKTAMQDERTHMWDLYFENISIFKNSAAYIGVVWITAMK